MAITIPTIPGVSTPPTSADPQNFALRGDTFFCGISGYDCKFARYD